MLYPEYRNHTQLGLNTMRCHRWNVFAIWSNCPAAKRLSQLWPYSSPSIGNDLAISDKCASNPVYSYQPSPFFVLDEVDAALDNTNVAKIANYIRSHASDSFQFIVISLKGSLYERSNSLVGIYRDQDVNSSRTMTLDVRFSSLLMKLHHSFRRWQLTQYDE